MGMLAALVARYDIF